MKKRLAAFLTLLLLAALLSLPAGAVPGYAPEKEIPAEAVYLVNLDTNLVVYAKNAEQPMSAASVTKLMTTILLLEDYQDQLDTVTVTAPGYIYDILYGTNSSTADIRRGDTNTLRNLLYAMMLPSGNEAAYIVADFMGGGDLSTFIARMNAEAEAIGCTGTHFVDPCGLDYDNVITARDAYLLLRTAIQYDAFVEAIATPTYDMGTNEHHTTAGSYLILNSDRMVVRDSPYYRSYTLGGKTGSLSDWNSFAGWHSKNGESYISVILQSPKSSDTTTTTPRPALLHTATLMDWAFATFTITPALDVTQAIYELPVLYSTDSDTVLLYPADDIMTLLPKEGGASLTTRTFTVPERLTAPVHQGDVVGTVTLYIEDEVIGTADLVAGADLERNRVLYTLARVGEFFDSTYFKVVVIVTMIAVAVYAFLWVVMLLIAASREGGSHHAPRR